MNPKFKKIVDLFRKLPGVGPRQAARFVLALMERSDAEIKEFGEGILNLKKDISSCPVCFNVSDNDKCNICSNPKRDQSKILVVEKVTDLDSIEKTGLYPGLYHVLGGAINPIDGITPDSLRLRELGRRVANTKKVELILATNLNNAGETTSMYIRDQFKDKKGVVITRLARGLSTGSHLEYADEMTLKHALEERR